MKPSVYIETTIPSYLTARPSRQLVRAAHQQLTRDWWDRRGEYELYTSRLVVRECSAGDPTAAADRLAALRGLTLLEQVPEADALAAEILRLAKLPDKAGSDAVHVATAALHGMSYLLTWNCTHIANPAFQNPIRVACRAAGCDPPVICTPTELLAEEPPDDDDYDFEP